MRLMPDADLVLVIDDEPQIRRAVRDALRDVAARIEEAANGSSGVEAATTGRPDLVVLDLGLPDMAGVDVCREIRQRRRFRSSCCRRGIRSTKRSIS